MVPALTTGGRSFKGAALYYLHDKRREGEAERLTSDRVAWTHAINLPTDDPDRAWRMMATTALKADELKAAAGVKSTGRKLTKPVSAYSLSWHPSERPTQAEQLEAAKETLKLLGLGEHQALIICHNDAPHAHVHIVANRVHPAEGKAAGLSNSKLILSEWALAYEQKRGKILCEEREKNQAKRKQAEYVRDPRASRPTHEFTRVAANGNIKAAIVRTEQTRKDAQLAAAGRTMHETHSRQWDGLKRTYAEAKDRLYSDANERKQARAGEVREAFKPHWRDLFRQQRDDRRAFEKRERSAIGTLHNMMATVRELRRQDQGTPGGLLAAVWCIISQEERRNALHVAQERERLALATRAKAATQQEQERIRRETKASADRLRDAFLKQCDALKAGQGQERTATKEAWHRRNIERKAAYEPLRDRSSKWKTLEEGRERGRDNERGMGLGLQRRRGPPFR